MSTIHQQQTNIDNKHKNIIDRIITFKSLMRNYVIMYNNNNSNNCDNNNSFKKIFLMQM
jgi:hypothetical protein